MERREQATCVEIDWVNWQQEEPPVLAEGGSLHGSYEPDKSRGLRPVL